MYYRDTWAEINLDRISENVRILKKHSGFKHLFAVVKSNAYGHGDVEVASAALEAGADMLCVSMLDEALHLRKVFRSTPILVMGVIRPSDLVIAAQNDIDITVHDFKWAESVIDYNGVPVKFHIKIDTGMRRLGISDRSILNSTLTLLEKNKNFISTGIFTHFSNIDEKTGVTYKLQLEKFKDLTKSIDFDLFKFVHLSNSGALIRFGCQSFANAGRLGIAMYGLSPGAEFYMPVPLQQVFSLHSRIVQIQHLKCGDKVGYGGTFIADKNMRIGIIPIGYADGWLRYHQGRRVEINSKFYELVGRICMDQCMVLIDDSINVGDRVDLINDNICINDIANDIGTISYEIACLISDRVPRIFKKNGVIISTRYDRFDI